MESKVHLIDCVEFMQGLPDKAFDLADKATEDELKLLIDDCCH